MARQSLPEQTDVVVVGGGIMGTSTAFFLATETDRDVALLEKENIASGSTGDSSAILRHHYGPREIYSRMAWWSHEFYRSFEEHTGERIAYAENPLVRFGVEGTDAGSYAESGYDVLSSLDIPVSRYEQDEFDEQYPMLTLDEADFAISDVDAGYSDGADAAGGFARAAMEAGADVITDIEVEEILVDAGEVTGVETDRGRVESNTTVVTAGPWTAELLAPLGVDIPIERSREQVLLLDPSDEYKEAYEDLIPTTGTPGGDWYVRSDFSDGVLVATHHTGERVDPDRYDDTPDEDVMLGLIDGLTDFAPELADAGISGRYCGVYSTTPDHDFIIDQVGPNGCFVGCGFSGHGFKHGPIVGRILTDLVTTGSTDLVDADFFSLDRFEKNPQGHDSPGDRI